MEITCQATCATSERRILAADLNEHNTLYGGRLLEFIDQTASISAVRYTPQAVVTGGLGAINFWYPFALGDVAQVKTWVTGHSNQTFEIFCMITAINPKTRKQTVGLSGYAYFVVPHLSAPLPDIATPTAFERTITADFASRWQQQKANLKAQKKLLEQLATK